MAAAFALLSRHIASKPGGAQKGKYYNEQLIYSGCPGWAAFCVEKRIHKPEGAYEFDTN